MAKKIEGWTGSIRKWGDGLYSHEMIVSDDPPFLDRRTYKAISAVIHDGEHERVFTESEVKGFAEHVVYQLTGEAEAKAIAAFKRMGIVLDPA
jgi:hypothetical protein